MKEYSYNKDVTHGAAIFEKGSRADTQVCCGDEKGLIIGTSKWIWLEEDDGKRICAALQYFSETSTEELERLAASKELYYKREKPGKHI